VSWLFLAVGVFICGVLLNSLLVRAVTFISPTACFLLIGSAAGFGLLVWLWLWTIRGVELAAGLLLYAALCELFLFLMSVVGTGISARMIRLLGEHPRSEAELRAGLSETAMVAMRIERLTDRGLAVAQPDGSWRLTAKGRRMAALARTARTFFGHSVGPA